MGDRLPLATKAWLVGRVWLTFVLVRRRVYREPLPVLVARLGRVRARRRRQAPARLSRAVDRSLRLGSRRPTCLVSALVLFHMLRGQGDEATVVIGLPPEAPDEAAHAWVEVDGRDVGPPPGRGRHVEMARFA